jgi:PAS domain S-box-containing protein/diguanylate cyclase (GGDEF)-like protein
VHIRVPRSLPPFPQRILRDPRPSETRFGEALIGWHRWIPAVIIGAAIGLWAVVSAWLLLGGGDEDSRLWATDVVPPVLDVMAASLLFLAAGREVSPKRRLAWALIGAAVVALTVADVLFAWFQLGLRMDPFPTAADVGYVAYYPLLVLALLTLPSVATDGAERRRFALDSLIVVLGGGLVVWQTVLRTTLEALDGDPAATILAIGYPVGDMVLLAGVAGIALRRPAGVDPWALVALVAGMCFVLVADVGYALLSLESAIVWPDVLYMASPAALAAAGWLQLRSGVGQQVDPVPRPIPSPLLYLPYLAMAAGYGTLLFFLDLDTDRVGMVIGAIALTVVVLGRQEMVLRQNSRLLAADARRESDERFRALAGNASDAIALVDSSGVVFDASDSSERVLGLEPRKLVSRSILRLAHADDARKLAAYIADCAAGRPMSDRLSWRLWDGDGAWRQVETIASNLIDDPKVGRIVLTTRDVRDRFLIEQQLRQMTLHDALTGLPNRVLLLEQIHEAMIEARGSPDLVVLISVTVEALESTIDALGAAAGSRLIQDVARRITAVIPEGAICARPGVSEFAVLLGRQALVSPEELGRRIETLLREPIGVGAEDVRLSPALGIAVASYARGPMALLDDARAAAASARADGGDAIASFRAPVDRRAANDPSLDVDLRAAIASGGLHLDYEPIVDLATREIALAEALVLWDHPTAGTFSASSVVTLAEEAGLGEALGGWILHAACAEAARWARAAHAEVARVVVRLSPGQVLDPNLPWLVQEALGRVGASPSWLCLEVETGDLIAAQGALARLRAVQSLGVTIGLLGFDRAPLALSDLQSWPLDYLVLDGSSVDPSGETDATDGLARALVEIGRSLGLTTIAQGVDSTGRVEQLLAIGCGLGQGSALGEPLGAATVRALVGERSAVET